jgi:hypothetical protein
LGAVAAAALAVWFWPGADAKHEPAARHRAPRGREPVPEPARASELPQVTRAPAPVAAAPNQQNFSATAPSKLETVVRARWGGKPGELGKRAANESNPEGPMSFAVDERGRAFVLDQVNSRVQVFEAGKAPKTVPLPSDTFQDVALAKNDGLVLLDRLSTGSVAFVDGTAKVTHEIALAGRGVSDAGDVTALFSREDGTWVEVKHQNLVRIADADGNPLEEREIVQGRFGENGTLLRASKSGASSAFVAAKTASGVAPLAKIGFDLPISEISALETDARGRIFLGANLVRESAFPPYDVEETAEVVVVLAPTGAELARVALPASTGAEESFRRVRVGADGALYQLAFDEHGATLRRVWL